MSVEFDAPPRFEGEVETLSQHVTDQLLKLSLIMNDGAVFLRLVPQHVEPKKTLEGMLVLADGSDWDPGDGRGVYVYTNGNWQFLG